MVTYCRQAQTPIPLVLSRQSRAEQTSISELVSFGVSSCRLVVLSCFVLSSGRAWSYLADLPAETGDFCWFCVRADTRASAQKRPSAKYAIAWSTGISRPNIGHALCIQSRNRKFSWVYFGAVCRTSPSLIRPRYMRLEPRGQEQKASEAKWTQRSAEAAETERRKKERIPK
ncbi:hypothetical protein EJF18_80286 [Clavispora lusitaniae]|uniref:Uncharacterized protein n=1 Tax=Clavispora lusitaniae TaxID=36911 RepID=A0ACD0WT21_CLALS|nr:hypothetical protein FOB63_004615 [Clavispora lusitaniae]QFZ30564.1 hypothetical protein EJF14_80286 [Clavispora lusitaniae]QFZ36226.1 hypothetical protein EJF16_80286 [Clavispora lusitaniae]QFZ41910.1 hypothetical protein EJF15_80286 [Clavispora lusitaniae]QFZ47586.1 hypothetical protein EJF18_80286 [Clavispora lusitaniae]